jgi:hypothetical protein
MQAPFPIFTRTVLGGDERSGFTRTAPTIFLTLA